MQTAFNILGALTVLTGLALLGSFGIGFLTHTDTATVVNGELTVTANILDRVLLGLFLLFLLATVAVWQNLRGGR